MAGARIEITKDTASPALKRLVGQLEGAGREQMLGQMGESLMISTRDRAAREVDPDGNKWRALSPAYARWKQKKRPAAPILKFDFHMLGDRLSYDIDAEGLLLGTSVPYGAIHQLGGVTHHAAHSRLLSFAQDKPNRMKVFARPGSKAVDHEKWASVPAYDVTMPPRAFLGLSGEDEVKLLDIAEQHVGAAFGGD